MKIQQTLEGYPVPEIEADAAMIAYLHSFTVKLLPVYEIGEAMSVLRGRIDADLTENILKINSEYQNAVLLQGNRCVHNNMCY